MTREFDVVVAGGGLVGTAFAALLAGREEARDLRVAVVESHPFSGYFDGEMFDPRVVALTEASRRMLADIGVWEPITARRVSPYTHMSVWDADGTGYIEFDSADIHAVNLGHIVEHSLIVGTLLESIAKQAMIEWICPASVTRVNREGGYVVIDLDNGERLRGSLLAGADGSVSRVRELCRFDVWEKPYGHKAIVATLRCELAHGAIARQWFSTEGPLAFLPLYREGDCHHVSIVWSQCEARADELMALSDDGFRKALAYASEYSLGEILNVSKRHCFPLRERHVSDYAQPGVALLGDAAHTIHPLAGQGVNLGFKDVMALVDELCWALKRDLPLGDMSVLGRYQRQRKPDNLATMIAMRGFKELFGSGNMIMRLLRNEGMLLVNKMAPLKKKLIRQAMGI